MSRTWLIDKSALVRLGSSPDAERWANRVERGLVAISTVTLLEAGFSARSAIELARAMGSPPLAAMPVEYLTPAAEDRAVQVQRLLAERGRHRGPSIPDLLIAAAAEWGPRKLWHAARRAGLDLGRDQLVAADARGRDRRRGPRKPTTRTTVPEQARLGTRTWSSGAGTHPPGVDQLWVADFSHVWTQTGFVYVAFVVDVFPRRILGLRVATSKHTPLVTDALHQALTTRQISESGWDAAGLILHSDAGSQYTSVALTAELLRHGMEGSIGTVGDALDNALYESTSGCSRQKAINDGGPTLWDRSPSRGMAGRPLGPLVNHHRLHSSIGDPRPIEFEQHHRQATTVTPIPDGAQLTSPPGDSGGSSPMSPRRHMGSARLTG